MFPVPKNDRETYIQIRDVARRFADEVVRPKAETLDRDERFPTRIYQQMGELGSKTPDTKGLSKSKFFLTPTGAERRANNPRNLRGAAPIRLLTAR
jgi:hypothetical protein